MKKIIAAVIACLMITAALTGCGSSNPLGDAESKASATEGTQAATEAKPTSFKDSFEGLVDYFHALGYITDDGIKNALDADYKAIGAEQGKKYVNGKVVIELYEFKSDSKKVLESVKKNGTFELYEKTIKAYLSSDERFMLIYDDATIKEDDTNADSYKAREKAGKAITEFGK
jgi:predicted small lipoprotein YifL